MTGAAEDGVCNGAVRGSSPGEATVLADLEALPKGTDAAELTATARPFAVAPSTVTGGAEDDPPPDTPVRLHVVHAPSSSADTPLRNEGHHSGRTVTFGRYDKRGRQARLGLVVVREACPFACERRVVSRRSFHASLLELSRFEAHKYIRLPDPQRPPKATVTHTTSAEISSRLR